jgi:hypothetical protein
MRKVSRLKERTYDIPFAKNEVFPDQKLQLKKESHFRSFYHKRTFLQIVIKLRKCLTKKFFLKNPELRFHLATDDHRFG